MGGGGLRILPHKSWHVWRRENIERVLRDEREQAEVQTRAELKRRRVEQERRAEALEHAQSGGRQQQGQQRASSEEATRGVRLFALEEQQQQTSSSRSDAQQQQTLGKQATLPWYAKRAAGERAAPLETSRRERKRRRALADEDPLRHMRPQRAARSGDLGDDFPAAKRSKDAEERTRREYRSEYSRSVAAAESRSPATAEERRRSERTSSTSSKTRTEESKKSMLMQQLRREREKREQTERLRAEALMQGKRLSGARW